MHCKIDNIQSLIHDLLEEDSYSCLQVEPNSDDQDTDYNRLFVARLVDSYDESVLCDRHGEKFLVAYGASFVEAINKLNELCT